MFRYSPLHNKIFILSHYDIFLEYPILTNVQKDDPSKTWFYWSKIKILFCKRGITKKFYFMKFFDCLGKFWTLPYGPKAQWSNSQKTNFIGFKQGLFWDPYTMCTFYLAYFKSGC